MSHQTQMELKIKDKDALFAALADLRLTKEQYEVHEEAQPLIDYKGKKTKYRWADAKDARFRDADKAHVIIRRKTLAGAHNDLGWYLDGDKSVFFICEYTKQVGSNRFKNDEGKKVTADAWMKALKQRYAFHVAKRHYAKQGKAVYTKKVGQKFHLFVR